MMETGIEDSMADKYAGKPRWHTVIEWDEHSLDAPRVESML